jgi:hypothetical protein
MDIIDQLAILDLTGTDLIECMYGTCAKKNISVMNVPDTILAKIKVTLCLQVFCFCV